MWDSWLIQGYQHPAENLQVQKVAILGSQIGTQGPRAFLVAQTVKHLPAMWETWLWALGWEDLLDEGMATHSSILAGESQGQRSLAGYSPRGRKELHSVERLNTAQYTDQGLGPSL